MQLPWSWRAGGKFRSEKQQAEERRETQQAEEHRQRAAEVAEALPSPAEASPPAAAKGPIPDSARDRGKAPLEVLSKGPAAQAPRVLPDPCNRGSPLARER